MESKISKYYNSSQLLFAAVNPTIAYLRWARGTGKTEGPICYRIFSVVTKMMGSHNALAVPSYQKFLKDLLPAIRRGLEMYDLIEGRDWVIGEKPPSKWARPYYQPKTYNAVFSFRTGTIYSLFSQDSKTKNQGNSLNSIIGDEAKLLDFQRIKEDILRAMRGGGNFWSHLPEFQSMLFCSDGWRSQKDYGWFFDAEKKANKEDIEMLIHLALNEKNLDERGRKALDYARKNILFYHKASAIDNADILGYNYFKNAYENSSPMEFLVSNLNYDLNRIEESFYTLLNDERHGRYAGNASYYEARGYGHDVYTTATCTGDDDINYKIPLELSFDFGGKHSCATVSQLDWNANTFSLLNDFVESGHIEICNEFDHYYAPFKQRNREVDIYYDLSGNVSRTGAMDTIAQEIYQSLLSKGWNPRLANTREHYIHHNDKYNIWKKVMYEGSDRDKQFPIFRYNRVKAERTALSMGNAPQRDEKGEVKKDKSSERKKSIPYEQATHLSDAVDNALCFQLIDIYQSILRRPWI